MEQPCQPASESLASAVPLKALDARTWIRSLLENPADCCHMCEAQFAKFDVNGNSLMEWAECATFGRFLAVFLGICMPELQKLRKAFLACDTTGAQALSVNDFEGLFKCFLRSSLRHLDAADEVTEDDRSAVCADLQCCIVQPAPGPGAHLTPDDLVRRWQSLTWSHQVVQFKGSEERKARTPVRCFSNFFDEYAFDFTLPLEICAPTLCLSEGDRTIRCDFSEKAIMLCKAASMGDLQSYKDIAATTAPLDAKNLGKLVRNWDAELWDILVCSVAFEVVFQKFSKIPEIQSVLLGTGESLIVEATRADARWGIGLDKGNPAIMRPSSWRGANVLGWALVEVRQKLLEAPTVADQSNSTRQT